MAPKQILETWSINTEIIVCKVPAVISHKTTTSDVYLYLEKESKICNNQFV